MNRMDKNQIYDEMCYMLTAHEHPEEHEVPFELEDFYKMLNKIAINWEELTAEDDFGGPSYRGPRM